jgi:hypothetical protein
MRKKKARKPLQRRLSKRNHNKWARWYVETHEKDLDEKLMIRFGIKLNLNKRKKEEFIKNILKAYWKSIRAVTFSNRNELYWSRRNINNKGELLFAFLVDKNNYAARLKFEENYAKRKIELDGNNDISNR